MARASSQLFRSAGYDVEMPNTGRAEFPDRTRADFLCARSCAELPGQFLGRAGRKSFKILSVFAFAKR